MISHDRDHLLFIEPKGPPSEVPIIDDLTRIAQAVWMVSTTGTAYRGWHICSCGAASDNCDHLIAGRFKTNSLMIHYMSRHRHEVPAEEIKKLREAFDIYFRSDWRGLSTT